MAASDYTIVSNAPMCPVGIIAGPVGYSATSIILRNVKNVLPNDIVAGMAAMIDDEIVRVESVSMPTITVARGCADTIPAVHQDNAPIWFFSRATGSDARAYVAADTIAVKLLPYSLNGANIPIEQSPPHDITFNWRHIRPYPPGDMKCDGTAWYNAIKTMVLGDDDLVWTWAHRDRLLQADQLVGHTEASIGPEPGTTYTAKVYNADNTLVRTVTGIAGTTWTYTRAMAEADAHVAAEAFVEIRSVRGGFESLYAYRTAVRLLGANATVIDLGAIGWPGVKTDCAVTADGLANVGTTAWDDYDIAFDGTEDEWRNTPISPIVYESTAQDLGVFGEYRFSLPATVAGVLAVEIATSADDLTYTAWAAPTSAYVMARYVKARYTVTGADPLILTAQISYFRRS